MQTCGLQNAPDDIFAQYISHVLFVCNVCFCNLHKCVFLSIIAFFCFLNN